jgi:flagellar capping protein FliD
VREQKEKNARNLTEYLDKYNSAMSALNLKTEETTKLLSENH